MEEANAIAARLRGGPVRQARGPAAAPTAKNLEVLAYMRDFFRENDQLPPVATIAEHFGMNTTGADWHIKALLRLGRVERNAVGKLRFTREKT